MDDDVNEHFSRRELIRGGMVLGAGLILGGCQGSKTHAYRDQPMPWSDDPITNRPRGAKRPREPISRPSAKPRQDQLAGVARRWEWTSTNPRIWLADSMNGISRITVHHYGMPPVLLRRKSDVTNRIEIIRRAHVNKGWADIGYHFVIDPMGRVWEGRPLQLQGAHVRDQNEHNLAVMVLGNFEEQRPTTDAIRTLESFVIAQMHRYQVPLNRVRTHLELANTTLCPGYNLQRQMVASRATGNIASA